MSEMSSRERSDLQQLARMNARVMKSDVDAVVADRIFAFEQELAKTWSTQEQVAAINAEVNRRCDELGIRPELRPQMLAGFRDRQYLAKERETELRRLAKAELEAAGKRAKVEIDRQTAGLCAEIISTGLASGEARSMLERVQSAESLVPSLGVQDIAALRGGRR